MNTIVITVVHLTRPLAGKSLNVRNVPFPGIFNIALCARRVVCLLSIVILLIALIVIVHVQATRLKHIFRTIKSSHRTSRTLSVHANTCGTLTCTLTTFFTNLTNSLLTRRCACVSPAVFGSGVSVLVLAVVILNNVGSPLNTILNSVILVKTPRLLHFTSSTHVLLCNILLILIVLFHPRNLFTQGN